MTTHEYAKGFVLMRFGRREDDLDQAEQLFISAIKSLQGSPETSRLANAHLQELEVYRAAIRGRDESKSLDRLVSTLSDDHRAMLAGVEKGARLLQTASSSR